jgi:hypothetical protein
MRGLVQATRPAAFRQPVFGRALVLAALLGAVAPGCAALTSPAADGVPVRLLPPEFLSASHCDEQTIPLTTLRQPQPPSYRVDAGDVLGIYPLRGHDNDRVPLVPLPVPVPPQPPNPGQHHLSPAAGFPVPVEADGTIALSEAGVLRVAGMTLPQIRAAVRALYVRKQLLKPEEDPVVVTLIQPRTAQVLVLRQEANNFLAGPDGVVANSKRGTGYLLDLPAYENDVLHALALTGGLPGLDACNAVIVQHGCFRDDLERTVLQQQLTGPGNPCVPPACAGETIRIPLRAPHGQGPCLRPEDVVLRTGDVVFVEAREDQYFYTAGLLPPGEHILPRDRDLDVLEAITLVHGTLFNGAFGGSNLAGNLIAPGIGGPSPTQLTVVRHTPAGQINIFVDLKCAVNDARERILVQPGDLLILQEKPSEALARWFSQTFFNFDLAWQVVHDRFVTGVVDTSTLDRLPGRLPTLNINPAIR